MLPTQAHTGQQHAPPLGLLGLWVVGQGPGPTTRGACEGAVVLEGEEGIKENKVNKENKLNKQNVRVILSEVCVWVW